MPKKINFVPYNTVKDYIKDIHNMRSGKVGTNNLVSRINSVIKTVIKDAVKLAKEDNRKTVLRKDFKIALKKNVGKKHLAWPELLKEVLRQNPTDLGKITKGVDKYIKANEKK